MADLTDIFLDTIKPFCVPAGSVVLLHSLSHLTWVGPAAYAEDLVRSRQRICGTYRTGILVLHGLPLPLDGCSDPNTANGLQAVTDWLSMAKDQSERDISTTYLLWRSRIIANCSVRPNECTSGVQPPATPNSSKGPSVVRLRRSLPIRMFSLRLHSSPLRFGLRPPRLKLVQAVRLRRRCTVRLRRRD